VNGEAFVRGIKAGSLGDRPAFEGASQYESRNEAVVPRGFWIRYEFPEEDLEISPGGSAVFPKSRLAVLRWLARRHVASQLFVLGQVAACFFSPERPMAMPACGSSTYVGPHEFMGKPRRAGEMDFSAPVHRAQTP
jgi:hypothetical protein